VRGLLLFDEARPNKKTRARMRGAGGFFDRSGVRRLRYFRSTLVPRIFWALRVFRNDGMRVSIISK
jgi:hypothetical protein